LFVIASCIPGTLFNFIVLMSKTFVALTKERSFAGLSCLSNMTDLFADLVTPLGNDGRTPIVGVDAGISGTMAGSVEAALVEYGIGGDMAGFLEIAMVDANGAKSALNVARVTTENVIPVEMEDLLDKDREELECEL
jgi:hypothetical protein